MCIQFITPDRFRFRPDLTFTDRQPLYHCVHSAFTPTNLSPSDVALTDSDVFALLSASSRSPSFTSVGQKSLTQS